MDDVEAVDLQAIGSVFSGIFALGLGISLAEASMRGWTLKAVVMQVALAIAIGGFFMLRRAGQRAERLSAQAIEARRAETGTGSVHESAVANGDAPR